MKPSIREIVAAHSTLVKMYREAYPILRQCLGAKGIHLNHGEPKAVGREPYDVAQGIEAMLASVTKSQTLLVSGLHNSTLYERGGNEWFRTVHDCVHLLYGLGFNPADEREVHRRLWQFLECTQAWHALGAPQKAVVGAVYYADTFGQTNYERRTGGFPEDQGAFTIKHVQRSLRNVQTA